MSQVSVYTDFVMKTDGAIGELRKFEQEVQATAARLNGNPLVIPTILQDGVTTAIENIKEAAEANPIELPVIVSDGATTAIDLIREGEEAKPIVLKVEADGGVGGGATGADDADGGSVGGGGGGRTGIFRSMFAARFAAREIAALSSEIEMGIAGENLNQSDVMAQSREKRKLIEEEHSGARGAVNWAYSKMGLGVEQNNSILGGGLSEDGQPSYESEIKQLDEADAQYKKSQRDLKQAEAGIKIQKRLRDQAHQTDESLAEDPNEDALTAKKREINKRLDKELEALDQLAAVNYKTEGFKSAGDQEQYILTEKGKQQRLAETDIAKATKADTDRINREINQGAEDQAREIEKEDREQQREIERFQKEDEREAKAQAAIDQRRADRIERQREQATELSLQSENKPFEAALSRVEYENRQSMSQAGDDPEAQKAAKELSAARLDQYRHQITNKNRASITSLGSYENLLLTGGNNQSTEDIASLLDRANKDKSNVSGDVDSSKTADAWKQGVDKWTPAVDKFQTATDAMAQTFKNPIQLAVIG